MSTESREEQWFRKLQNLEGEEVLVVTETDQLNLFGQTFRPIFTGTIHEISYGHLTLFPVIIKILNAPFFKFPIPLSIPLEKLVHLTPNFDPNTRFPLT
ncbi:hypothetical protein [Halalkalibacterium ligniniphilum]|uniref:hypothetical protein n=1 Tax=Halalkalibacterium ligniniphilum TaxID=1134413 RepID=UPI0003498BEC|nr:hypothetical protein [Halalkalibacterium ligniniphilum]